MTLGRRLVLGAAVLAGTVPLILWAAGSRSSPDSSASVVVALPVTTVTATAPALFEVTREYTGSLKAARSTAAAFLRSGRVVELLVDQGDGVEVDQVVAQLDKRHLLAERRQREAQLNEAVARLDELLAGPRKEQIAAAEAEMRSLRAEQQLQELNAERRKKLAANNAVAVEELDSAAFGLEASNARLAVAEERLRELRTGSRAEHIEAARAAVEQREAALETVTHDLDDCLLRAPFAGTVAERFVDEGAVITAQTPVVRIVEDHRLEAWIGLPTSLAAKLTVGQRLALRCDGQRFEGAVRAVLPEVDLATRTRRVVLHVPELSGLVAGRVVRLEVSEPVSDSGLLLPTTALAGAHRGLWSCFVVASDPSGATRVERRDLEVLHTSGEYVLVRGALREGESVVAAGTHRLAHGQVVRVLRPGEADVAIAQPGRDSATVEIR